MHQVHEGTGIAHLKVVHEDETGEEGGDGGGAPRGRLSVRRLPGKLEAGEAELGAQVELDRRGW